MSDILMWLMIVIYDFWPELMLFLGVLGVCWMVIWLLRLFDAWIRSLIREAKR